jgi:hypothetical protein
MGDERRRRDMKALLGLVTAVALTMPVQAARTVVPMVTSAAPVILIEGDCGRDYHRDERGFCRPNWREMEGRACPPGYHLGSEGRRCWPN